MAESYKKRAEQVFQEELQSALRSKISWEAIYHEKDEKGSELGKQIARGQVNAADSFIAALRKMARELEIDPETKPSEPTSRPHSRRTRK